MGQRIARRIRNGVLALVLAFGVVGVGTSTAQAKDWVGAGSSCTTGGVKDNSKMTMCWARKKLKNDGSKKVDYFAFRQTLTAYALKKRKMQKVWVEPLPTGVAQAWTGADPFMPDQTQESQDSCVMYSRSVGGGAIPATFSTSTNVCKKETFGPKLYKTPGHHAGVWYRKSCIAAGKSRKVYAGVTVKVKNGKTATWTAKRYGANVGNNICK